MESFFSRYRNLIVLLALLAAQLLGLAMQVRRVDSGRNAVAYGDSKGVRLIRLWANAVVTPPEEAVHWVKMSLFYTWQNYIDLHNVRQQNHDLQQTIDRLRLEQAQLLEDARQGERLQAILGFQQQYIYSTVAAQAIGSSGSDQSRVFYINKGEDAHLKPDMAVITGDGVVGKIREVFGHTAQVLEVNDQSSGAGVILETTRLRGILRGNAMGQLMVVLMNDQRIKPGEKVLTAGGDMVFPRGLPVGEVEKVVRDPDRDSFIDVMLKPAASLSRIDEVQVITSTEPRFPPEQLQDMAQSELEKVPVLAAMKAEAARQKAAQEEAAKQQALKDQQQKAAEQMADRLPGLNDPNKPADQQDPADKGPVKSVGHVPQALHADRFSPGAAAGTVPAEPRTQAAPRASGASGTGTAAKPAVKPAVKPATKPAAPAGTERE